MHPSHENDTHFFIHAETCSSVAELLKHYYESIQQLMVNSPVESARKLFSRGFINEQTQRNVVMTEGTSNDSKADQLTHQCIQYITNHSDPVGKLRELLLMLEQVDPAASIVAEKIRKVCTFTVYLYMYNIHNNYAFIQLSTNNITMFSLFSLFLPSFLPPSTLPAHWHLVAADTLWREYPKFKWYDTLSKRTYFVRSIVI